MRRIQVTGLALIAVCATGLMATGTAAGSPKVLEIKEGMSIVPAGSAVFWAYEYELKTTTGNLGCEGDYNGILATNLAKVDTFTETNNEFACDGLNVALGAHGFGGVSIISASAKGKTTLEVGMFIPWPAPYEHCEYTGKGNKPVKGENTVAGFLSLHTLVKPAKLTGTNCPQKKAELTLGFSEIFGSGPLEVEVV